MDARRREQWIASTLFVASGATALIYETVWFKRLGHAWGNSSLAMASVVASFLCGLGIGAWILGRIADRARSPLALYGWCEIAIGLLAFVIPWEIRALLAGTAGFAAEHVDDTWLLVATRFASTFAIIGPPCALMGGTLPLLVRQFAGAGLSVGASTAWLYAFNALGAAAGAWGAGFFLLERFGLGGTNACAALVNIAVGCAAVALAPRFEVHSRAPEVEAPAARDTSPASSPRMLALVALATGCASIALQMIWARKLALLVGGTTYAFSAILAVFILGIGLGSLWFRQFLADRVPAQRVALLAAALVVLPAMLGAALEDDVALWIGHVRHARADPLFNALVCAGTAAFLELGPAIGMGMLFPLLVQHSRSASSRAGHAVARVYAWNTLGSITGAATAALVLLPNLGELWSSKLALAVYALVPLLLFNHSPAAGLGSIAGLALLFSSFAARDPRALNSGAFLYGPDTRAELERSTKVESFVEGATCNTLVLSGLPGFTTPRGDALVNLRVNGKIDASTGEDMPMQLAMAYFPRFLRPEARRVALIGMGSGVSAGASALFDGTEVVVCEIEPSIVAAARFFDGVNHRPLERANVRVVLDDGRSFLQGAAGPWDMILSEPSNPWIAGIANLFTEEFYVAARERLAPDGVLAQWVQTYSFSEQEYALVVRTIQRVFGSCVFFRVSHYDTLLVASRRDVVPAAGALDAAQALVERVPALGPDLERWYGTRDVRSILLARMWLDERGLARFAAGVGGTSINTDSNLRLEFDAPRRLFHSGGDPGGLTLARLAGAVDPAFVQQVCSRWNCGAQQVGGLRALKTDLFQTAAPRPASAIVELALAYDPEDPELLVDKLLFDAGLAREEFDELSARVIDASPLEALRLGRQLGQLGQHNAARVVFEALTQRHPTSATAWLQLSGELARLGRASEAETALQRARELDPIDDLLRESSSTAAK
jgi:predicted membrane-bound spermidine synthase